MNKKLLIISPYFPPTNAADMQRVRMSLPYFAKFGWDAEVVTINAQYSDLVKDDLLMQSVPDDVKMHSVGAFNKKWTAKFGLGSLGIRALWFYKQKVNQLLKAGHYHLIYFSTTQFPVCILGAYWQKRFGVPYVIDMQDPWHSDYYQDKPKAQRPPKYWFSYRLNKYLEPIAMKSVNGLIGVSEAYIDQLKNRYPQIKHIPGATIPFSSYSPDIQIAQNNVQQFPNILDNDFVNIVYIGRGGSDMIDAVTPLFKALGIGLASDNTLFSKLKLYFIGTSYAAAGTGKPTIILLASQHGVSNQVIEITDRISYYHTLLTLHQADALFIPGSNDANYSASKIYPYLLSGKPLLTVFNSKSPVITILNEFGAKHNYSYDATPNLSLKITDFLKQVLNKDTTQPTYNTQAIKKYGAENMTQLQCNLFNEVINGKI